MTGIARQGQLPLRQKGAALLLALLTVALVATLASAALWRQWRNVEVETSDRSRMQAGWVLSGALDWARLILREDERSARRGGTPVDSLDEPWAQPLAEARLSSFLAADRDNNADSGPEAFISGAIEDAQSRLNLRGLVDGAGQVDAGMLEVLGRLVVLVGAPADAAPRLVEALKGSTLQAPGPAASGVPSQALRPLRWDELAWFGIDSATLARLAPHADLLPLPTPVNVNTASRVVLAAVVPQLDLGGAERIVQQRHAALCLPGGQALRHEPAGPRATSRVSAPPGSVTTMRTAPGSCSRATGKGPDGRGALAPLAGGNGVAAAAKAGPTPMLPVLCALAQLPS